MSEYNISHILKRSYVNDIIIQDLRTNKLPSIEALTKTGALIQNCLNGKIENPNIFYMRKNPGQCNFKGTNLHEVFYNRPHLFWKYDTSLGEKTDTHFFYETKHGVITRSILFNRSPSINMLSSTINEIGNMIIIKLYETIQENIINNKLIFEKRSVDKLLNIINYRNQYKDFANNDFYIITNPTVKEYMKYEGLLNQWKEYIEFPFTYYKMFKEDSGINEDSSSIIGAEDIQWYFKPGETTFEASKMPRKRKLTITLNGFTVGLKVNKLLYTEYLNSAMKTLKSVNRFTNLKL